MLCSCTHMATVGIKGLKYSFFLTYSTCQTARSSDIYNIAIKPFGCQGSALTPHWLLGNFMTHLRLHTNLIFSASNVWPRLCPYMSSLYCSYAILSSRFWRHKWPSISTNVAQLLQVHRLQVGNCER